MKNEWGYDQQRLCNAPPVRELMRDGKWLVPPKQRPRLAPPPREESRHVYEAMRSIVFVGERNR